MKNYLFILTFSLIVITNVFPQNKSLPINNINVTKSENKLQKSDSIYSIYNKWYLVGIYNYKSKKIDTIISSFNKRKFYIEILKNSHEPFDDNFEFNMTCNVYSGNINIEKDSIFFEFKMHTLLNCEEDDDAKILKIIDKQKLSYKINDNHLELENSKKDKFVFEK